MDPGYATVPRLLELIRADQVDAVFVSHGHPDHCADLNPLLRARALRDDPAPPLPVYSLPGALDAVMALDRPRTLAGSAELREFAAGDSFGIGPFSAVTCLLPHWLPNAGIRLTASGKVLAYTGDSGPSPSLTELAGAADLLLAEATYVDALPEDSRLYLSSARDAGQLATRAGARRLILTHMWPDTDQRAALGAAAAGYDGEIDIATGGLDIELR